MSTDDPKLTAYALGEFEALTPQERRAIEEAIALSPELRAFVEETAAFGQLLGGVFASEMPECQLDLAQRAELCEKAAHPKVHRFSARHLLWASGIVGIAAAVVLLPFLAMQRNEPRKSTAETEARLDDHRTVQVQTQLAQQSPAEPVNGRVAGDDSVGLVEGGAAVVDAPTAQKVPSPTAADNAALLAYMRNETLAVTSGEHKVQLSYNAKAVDLAQASLAGKVADGTRRTDAPVNARFAKELGKNAKDKRLIADAETKRSINRATLGRSAAFEMKAAGVAPPEPVSAASYADAMQQPSASDSSRVNAFLAITIGVPPLRAISIAPSQDSAGRGCVLRLQSW